MKNPLELVLVTPAFSIYRTSDGSPTMAFVDGGQERSEFMHSTHGAFSESIYHYSEAIRLAQDRDWKMDILSVGLGLGYNELIAAAQLSTHPRKVSLTSFESEAFLCRQFIAYLQNEALTDDWIRIYDTMAEACSRHFDVNRQHIKQTLLRWLKDGDWQIHGALGKESLHPHKYSVILFDAFSRRTSPALWAMDFIEPLIEKYCQSNCVFATYASTGDLKRLLKCHGFPRPSRPGYGGKRESTFAIRCQE